MRVAEVKSLMSHVFL